MILYFNRWTIVQTNKFYYKNNKYVEISVLASAVSFASISIISISIITFFGSDQFWSETVFLKFLLELVQFKNSLSRKEPGYFQKGLELLIEAMEKKQEQKNVMIIIPLMVMDEAAAASHAAYRKVSFYIV